MKTHNSRQKILAQRSQMLQNLATNKKTTSQKRLQSLGNVLYSEAKQFGFVKVGWDVYQRPVDIDAGNIWSLEEIEGDKWLVCYTDANDHILRNLTKESTSRAMQKTAKEGSPKSRAADVEAIKEINESMGFNHNDAPEPEEGTPADPMFNNKWYEQTKYGPRWKGASVITEPELGYGLQPGDLVEITPYNTQSVHSKYIGLKGVVTAAMPDRSKLTFGDGSSMWFENNDLTTVTDAKEMQVGDSVRMFAHQNVSGKITKMSHDGLNLSFKNDIGQEFHARKTDVVKEAVFVMHSQPGEEKSVKQILENIYNPAPAAVQDAAGGSAMKDIPPSIKQNPSSQEMGAGTSMPASEVGGGGAPSGMDMGMGGMDMGMGGGDPMSMAADIEKSIKRGRRMNVGDAVQSKSTGEKGTVVDIQFDRKLGKFYLINFGGQREETVYETDLMKLKEFTDETEAFPMPTEVTPGPSRLIGAKRAVMDPRFQQVKEAALDFVTGMVSQALKNHEQENPGSVEPMGLTDTLTKQAITTYISKYLPIEYQQAMASDEKNALSEWLLDEVAGTKEDAPTAQEFMAGENTAMPAQRTPQEIAGDLVQAHITSHVKIAKYTPGRFVSPIERNRFLREAVGSLCASGIEDKTAQFIAHSVLAADISDPFVKHALKKQFGYTAELADQLQDVASTKLATSIFTTSHGEKYALDLPGMETLRGGGGGYPGGMDLEPMGWEVKSPNGEEEDPEGVENALMEQLGDQSKPFDEAAPKLNIELDSENKKIVIDYNQEEAPPMPIEGAEGLPGEEDLNVPSPSGPAGPKPGDVKGPGGNAGGSEFSNMDVPVNF